MKLQYRIKEIDHGDDTSTFMIQFRLRPLMWLTDDTTCFASIILARKHLETIKKKKVVYHYEDTI
jgi:hypothetical protein